MCEEGAEARRGGGQRIKRGGERGVAARSPQKGSRRSLINEDGAAGGADGDLGLVWGFVCGDAPN